ncbi:hypothetical protein pEaSNUABM14_00247 [Erwinia phage pEa_SNUABM_14]|uniref:Uncharacterized protein n=1 Tax=Erwinia phage pEa_SNUABM_7 TaxID=2866695 RepID=A0AAE8BLY7_9CAUD|nr:hypothetical protein MPK74_gp248 [Erwinia phage pEa_SNUABM_7]QYW04572.1 hypothetical protein pEaSNUABM14_00247 [Erwinia phage pEa_SNUABM_14]QYW04916.1 hypothetical protein pEaSNUABM7_00248 [Erwinia phage pEa_SNUABM_7]
MTIKFVEVPNISMFEGLVHGANRHAQNANIGGKARYAFYVDVTEAAAEAALYSMLRKKAHADVRAVGYSVSHTVRGMTQPKEIPVFLSDNLSHISLDSLKQNLCELLRALCRSAASSDSNIILYYQKDMAFIKSKMFDWVLESKLSRPSKVDCELYVRSSNIDLNVLLNIVRDHDYIGHFASSIPQEITIGSDASAIDAVKLCDTADVLAAQGRKVHLCNDIYRKAVSISFADGIPRNQL